MGTKILLWDTDLHLHLAPFTLTRPVGDLRVGILTIKEKYEKIYNETVGFITQKYLSFKFGNPFLEEDEVLIINGALLPHKEVLNALDSLKLNEALFKEDKFLGVRIVQKDFETLFQNNWSQIYKNQYDKEVTIVDRIFKIFGLLDSEIRNDYDLITFGRKSAPIDSTNTVKNPENIFIESGATVFASVLNASTGPIYIGKDSEIMEGCLVRGPFSLGNHAQLKMGAKIYGATAIGNECRVGGEVNNSLFYSHSNKGHDGFVGNAVIGQWCNIGADSNNSNLKNNYEEVKLWNFQLKTFEKTGLTFCGLFMGDHTKCGINTMFNTGTVTGVSANIFGSGFPRNIIPSFAWGGASGFQTYKTEKAFETAEKVFQRRNMVFDEKEQFILTQIFEDSKEDRNF